MPPFPFYLFDLLAKKKLHRTKMHKRTNYSSKGRCTTLHHSARCKLHMGLQSAYTQESTMLCTSVCVCVCALVYLYKRDMMQQMRRCLYSRPRSAVSVGQQQQQTLLLVSWTFPSIDATSVRTQRVGSRGSKASLASAWKSL